MEIPPWYVITGTLYSGKSAIINELAIKGFQTVPEVATTLINKNKLKGIPSWETRKDEALFQQKIYEMKLEVEENIPKDRIVFFDRGLPDSIAYYKFCGLDAQELEHISKDRYSGVFFLEALSGYEKGGLRKETPDEREIIGRFLRQAYEDLGYHVIFIPKLPIEERLDLILSNVPEAL